MVAEGVAVVAAVRGGGGVLVVVSRGGLVAVAVAVLSAYTSHYFTSRHINSQNLLK